MFVFSSRCRHTSLQGDWSSDVCSSDLERLGPRVKDEASLTLPGAFLIGIGQAAALIPGMSRSGTTIADGKIGRASWRGRVVVHGVGRVRHNNRRRGGGE